MDNRLDLTGYDLGGEWLKLEMENGILEVKLIPASINRLFNIIKEDMVGVLISAVVDWNIYIDDKKLECNEENKRIYLGAFSTQKILNPTYAQKGAMFETVGAEIIAFAQNINNFLKNSRPTSHGKETGGNN